MRIAATRTALPAALAAVMLISGCGIQQSGLEEGPEAPTGLAPGATLYFVDEGGELVAQQRDTGQLGSISDAVGLLLTGPGDSGLETDIDETTLTRVGTSVRADVVELRLPLSSSEVDGAGIDQIVCTAAATHIQAGGAEQDQVQLRFTDLVADPASCPVL
ncbi:hypothetical protein [Brevibacterium aurantiacum]|uniref:GerMN domain-containing protein n=1 Tax=Brevibacterium aurantiacum TaxID=273384 RepID=A0A556C2T5_BREAU|nr:hypothetical protein [Brevibacterium aurantiacum]TSI11731.1 hypothetical protein FO013_21575 [Brevibacterium aurantiacum]